MAKTENYLGIDIGSSQVRVVMAQEAPGEETLRVLGAVTMPSEGIRRGTVIDASAVASAVAKAVSHAERMSGVTADTVGVGVSGTDIFCQKTLGVIAVSRPDGEVAEDDVERAMAEVEARVMLPSNREVLHVIPKSYRLDDQKDIKDPVGMRGVRLEAEAFVIGTSMNQMKGVGRILDQVGIRPDFHAVGPLAASEAVLNQKQKELGVALVDIGGSTTSVAVYEEGELVHLAVLPVGGTHVTNDIAIGLRTSIETAEQVKLQYGTALPETVGKREEVDLSRFDSHETESVSRHHVAEIIEARMDELLRFVNSELAKCGREGLLPAGAVLTGGGSLLPGAVELAKEILRLPSHVGYPKPLGGILDQVDGPDFASAVGLVLLSRERGHSRGAVAGIGFLTDGAKRAVPEWALSAGKRMHDLLKKFLPLD
ncbi:MAG: cell division protein FtsA [Candidatus Moranbacteria bacterium]|nr:cell division protein FtsA [Candidatus Moranbacteria bacterium]NTW46188.1 cell division protein FtsA [Candidatus Moranbacteria bacterium]